MAISPFKTKMFMADKLVESAGTVLFWLTTHEICVLHHVKSDKYLLPKGRRNLGESRLATAIRETAEETGYPCRLLPINLLSRICPAIEEDDTPDEARYFEGCCEAVAVQNRHVGEDQIKIIWWYVAAVNGTDPVEKDEADTFRVEFHGYDEVLQKLTVEDDRKLVQRAIQLVNSGVSE